MSSSKIKPIIKSQLFVNQNKSDDINTKLSSVFNSNPFGSNKKVNIRSEEKKNKKIAIDLEVDDQQTIIMKLVDWIKMLENDLEEYKNYVDINLCKIKDVDKEMDEMENRLIRRIEE